MSIPMLETYQHDESIKNGIQTFRNPSCISLGSKAHGENMAWNTER